MSNRQWLSRLFSGAVPPPPTGTVSSWAERHMRLPGSARSERFEVAHTPWTREVIDRIDDGVTRTITFVKPVQSGGSVTGEIAIAYWIATQTGGDIQYNWEDDEKAGERWDKRIKRILRACPSVLARWPQERHDAKRGMVMFPHLNLTVQGVHSASNLDSDSIRFQVNEELHNWEPGRLEKAYNRTTAFWNSVVLNISNAGCVGDQLEQAFLGGTQQQWEVKCPGCARYHGMFTRTEKGKPGGLKYDSDKCKRADGYDYNALESTIRYEFPCCGFVVRDTPQERRALSVSGRYSEPRNENAHASHRSYTYEAVSVDYIPWIKLVKQKHDALRALKYGNNELWKRYMQERECRFWKEDDRPIVRELAVAPKVKSREGLKGDPMFTGRYFALDRQQGSQHKGELPHWWLVIRDALSNGDSELVFEGKIETDENVIQILDSHECVRYFGVADSGDDTTHVYSFCLRYGVNAIKGGKTDLYAHDDGSRLIYGKPTPLWLMRNLPGPVKGDGVEEPEFWLYSKSGIRERLNWMRSSGVVQWRVPADISDDYRKHMESEDLEERQDSITKERKRVWVQRSDRNDLFVCECYIAMMMEKAGLISVAAEGANHE